MAQKRYLESFFELDGVLHPARYYKTFFEHQFYVGWKGCKILSSFAQKTNWRACRVCLGTMLNPVYYTVDSTEITPDGRFIAHCGAEWDI